MMLGEPSLEAGSRLRLIFAVAPSSVVCLGHGTNSFQNNQRNVYMAVLATGSSTGTFALVMNLAMMTWLFGLLEFQQNTSPCLGKQRNGLSE
jgi:hypothetical protein